MDNYSALKRNEFLMYATTSMYLKHFAKLNKPKKKGQILYDSTSEVPKINKFIENTIEVTTRSWMT